MSKLDRISLLLILLGAAWTTWDEMDRLHKRIVHLETKKVES